MFSLLSHLRKDLVFMAQEYQMIIDYEDRRDASKVEAYAWAIVILTYRFLNGLYCRKFGCKLVDDSQGTPDHGYVSMYCDRCGYSYHEILY